MGVYSEHSPEASAGSNGVEAAALKTEEKGATSCWYGADGPAGAPRRIRRASALTSAPAAVQLTNLFHVSYISPLLGSSRRVCRPGVDWSAVNDCGHVAPCPLFLIPVYIALFDAVCCSVGSL
jgi:hypothetical protein